MKRTNKIARIHERGNRLARIVRASTAIVVAIALSALTGCSFPNFGNLFPSSSQGQTDPTPTQPPVDSNATLITADQITLQWDPPTETPDHYDVFYRIHGASDWSELGQASQADYTVLHSTLGNGQFDFAVASVNTQNVSSGLHSSLDQTAIPSTGWYVEWQR